MTGKDLFCGMNHVSERLIEEAETTMLARSRKRPGLCFLIAALISMLGVVAFATSTPDATRPWFFSFFGNNSTEAESVLTENQNAILDAGLVEINQYATCNGYTITLESGLCDGYKALIKCRIDAPEEVSLNGTNYALGCIEFLDGVSGDFSSASYTGYPLEDDDPNDNSITLLLDIIVQPSHGSNLSLANDLPWGISFSSIEELTGSGDNIAWNTLCEGIWEFKVMFDDNLLVTKSTELLSKPVRCLWNLYVRNWKIPFRAKIISFELRSLTATIRYERPWITFYQGVYFDQPIYLILNDGTKVRVEIKLAAFKDAYNETLCYFDQPVSVGDVAYIEFPGVGQVAVANDHAP